MEQLKPSPEHLRKGASAEKQALNFLVKQQLSLITQNYACQYGEIDLIMQDNEYLVFVEIRYRKQNKYGNAVETVSRSKQSKIIKTAYHFLQRHSEHQRKPCRFDIIDMTTYNNAPQIEWYQHAFTLDNMRNLYGSY